MPTDIDDLLQPFNGKSCTVCQALQRLDDAERDRIERALAHERVDANKVAERLTELVGRIEASTVRRHRKMRHGA